MWQAIRETLRSILLDHGLFPLFLLAVPAYSFFYPAAYSTEAVRGIRVEVVDLDSSTMSRQIIRDLAASPSVELLGTVSSIEVARRDMADGRCAGVAIIPANFYRDVLRSTPTTVETWGTGAFPVQDKAVLESVGAAVQSVARQAAVARMVRQGASTAYARLGDTQAPAYIEQNLFNITRGYGSYVVAAVAILIVQQVLLIGIAMLLGTWIEKRALPLFPPTGLAFAPFVGVWFTLSLFVLPAFLYMVGFAFWYQDYPRGGNIPAAIAFSVLMSFAIAAMGLCMGTLFGKRERALQIMLATSIPALFLSGAMYPHEAIPVPLQMLADLLPTTPGINGYIKLNQMGANWSEIRAEVIHVSLLIPFYALIAWAGLKLRASRIIAAQSTTSTSAAD